MSAIHLITDDIYFRTGFKMLIEGISRKTTCSVSIMDDGVQFLYFIDTTRRSGRIPPQNEAVEFFLERVRLVVPKNIYHGKLQQIIKSYCRGVYNHMCFTPGERRILKEIARGIPSDISRSNMGVEYKTWHNVKAAAFKRLGIKNTVTFMRAIHTWNSIGYQSVFKTPYINSSKFKKTP